MIDALKYIFIAIIFIPGLGSSTFGSIFLICKYKHKFKYSQDLDVIKYTKYFFNQVEVQVPSTLVTNNSTVSLDPKSIYNHPGTYSFVQGENRFQICTKNHNIYSIISTAKLCICHQPCLWIMLLTTEDHDYLQSDIFWRIFKIRISAFLVKFHWSVFPFNNKSSLVQLVAWRWTGCMPVLNQLLSTWGRSHGLDFRYTCCMRGPSHGR